jgi:hypothetical protein
MAEVLPKQCRFKGLKAKGWHAVKHGMEVLLPGRRREAKRLRGKRWQFAQCR